MTRNPQDEAEDWSFPKSQLTESNTDHLSAKKSLSEFVLFTQRWSGRAKINTGLQEMLLCMAYCCYRKCKWKVVCGVLLSGKPKPMRLNPVIIHFVGFVYYCRKQPVVFPWQVDKEVLMTFWKFKIESADNNQKSIGSGSWINPSTNEPRCQYM